MYKKNVIFFLSSDYLNWDFFPLLIDTPFEEYANLSQTKAIYV